MSASASFFSCISETETIKTHWHTQEKDVQRSLVNAHADVTASVVRTSLVVLSLGMNKDTCAKTNKLTHYLHSFCQSFGLGAPPAPGVSCWWPLERLQRWTNSCLKSNRENWVAGQLAKATGAWSEAGAAVLFTVERDRVLAWFT